VQRHLVINGPNLNLLGRRDPETYGHTTLPQLEDLCRGWGAELGVEVDVFQSNHEGALIDTLHAARTRHDGIVFNPGAFTHSSYALHDAIEAIEVPTVEVHISNVEEREPWRRVSVVRPACVATIYGRGVEGYRWGMRHLLHRTEWPVETIAYADHADAVVDIRRPEGAGPYPLIVLVHGGFWRHLWTRDIMDGIAVDLTRRGFLTANVEYRRVGTGGGWPQSAQDVATAIDTVANAESPSSVTVVGHSAGGHLAVMARSLTTHPYLPVSLAGVLDLEAGPDLGAGAVPRFLGDVSARSASPASAARNIGPVLAVHGDADDTVPIGQSLTYGRANPDCHVVTLEGVGHQDFLDRSDPAWSRVIGLLAERLTG
jgi:3-dehydroquinate dehydratase II